MTKHSSLGASGAHRWLACPGSLREISKIEPRLRENRSTYAAEGQAAHALAEILMRGASVRVGEWIDDSGHITPEPDRPGFFEVTDEMMDAVQLYIDRTEEYLLALPMSRRFIEQRVYPLADREDMFGTGDAVIVQAYGALVVIDFKYGAGVKVEAEQNDQMMYYGLGALNELGDDAAVESVTLEIVQPRAFHVDGPIRTFQTSVAELRRFEDLLRSGAAATEDPKAPLIPGGHCQFCPAKAFCPALSKLAVSTAISDFDDLTEAAPRLPSPQDPDQIARALALAPIVEEWAKEVYKVAFLGAQRGMEIPGYKLVRKNAHRKWQSEAALVQAASRAGVTSAELYDDPKLKSPAQLEKNKKLRELVAKHAIKPEGELTLVKSTDSRPAALPSAVTDFDGVDVEAAD